MDNVFHFNAKHFDADVHIVKILIYYAIKILLPPQAQSTEQKTKKINKYKTSQFPHHRPPRVGKIV